MTLKLAIVVPGRFHAFDVARELIRHGTDLFLLTNYPRWAVSKYGLPPNRVLSCLSHGLLGRTIERVGGRGATKFFEPLLHRWFSRWATRQAARLDVDVIHSFSGVSEEILRHFPRRNPWRCIVRGSAHIRAQTRLLSEEQDRCGCSVPTPSQWMIQREVREYDLADLIIVLSSFAARTFQEEGFSPDRLRVLSLGTELGRFRATADLVEARCRRILSNQPLRVLTVGSFSYQKGAYDLARIAHCLAGQMHFRFVGDCPAETRNLQRQCRRAIEFVPRQAQFTLVDQYRQGDIFLFPTIQDGYAAVLAQAQAAGLPVLTTTNCAGPDLVQEGVTGWVVPIRQPESIIDRLRWCRTHREALAGIVRNTFHGFQPRDWSTVASELLEIYHEVLPKPSPVHVTHP